jgi:hypothetical protein
LVCERSIETSFTGAELKRVGGFRGSEVAKGQGFKDRMESLFTLILDLNKNSIANVL